MAATADSAAWCHHGTLTRSQECLRFLRDDELREETGRRAREHALQSFALDSCIDAFREWYEIAVNLRVAPATSDDVAYVAGMAS